MYFRVSSIRKTAVDFSLCDFLGGVASELSDSAVLQDTKILQKGHKSELFGKRIASRINSRLWIQARALAHFLMLIVLYIYYLRSEVSLH